MIKIECDELNEVQTVMDFFKDYELTDFEIEETEETTLLNQKHTFYTYILRFEDRI